MITQIVLYTLKVALILALFYGCYHVLFRRTKFFQLNRFYLLHTSVIAFFIPLFQFSWSSENHQSISPVVQQVVVPINRIFSEFGPPEIQVNTPDLMVTQPGIDWSWSLILFMIYLTGVVISAMFLIVKLSRLYYLVRESKRESQFNQSVLRNEKMATSSFFSILFWQVPDEENNREWVVKHEQIHMAQWHSLDNLFMEFVCIFQWFNPIVYSIRNELKVLHEYIADHDMSSQVDKVAYGQLLINQNTLPQPPLGSTFQSFIKQRLEMLKQRKTPSWKRAFYLFTLPLMLMAVLLFSSWIFNDTSDLESALDKDHTLFSDHSSSSDLLFEWGHFERKIPLLPWYNGSGEPSGKQTYRWHEKIGKPKILSLFDKPISLTSKTSSSLLLEKLELHINHTGTTSKIASFDPGELQYLDSSLKDLIENNKSLILYFTGTVDSKPVHISFHLLDFTDKADYLKWGDLQFDIFSAYGPLPVQVITWETMVELTQRSHELFKNGQSNGGRYGTLLVKDGTSTVMVPPTLSEKIRNDHEIKHPIILQVIGSDGRPYSAVFDDEPNPKLHYETWDEICYDYSFIEHAEVKVDEPIWQFSWGPLQASRPPTSYKVMFENIPYFKFETLFEGKDGFSGSASTEQLNKMLNGRAQLKVKEGKEFERFEIKLTHIKPQGLPTDYHFEYFGGKPTNDQEIKNLIEQLKSGDFIDIRRIAPINQNKHIRFYFKVM